MLFREPNRSRSAGNHEGICAEEELFRGGESGHGGSAMVFRDFGAGGCFVCVSSILAKLRLYGS